MLLVCCLLNQNSFQLSETPESSVQLTKRNPIPRGSILRLNLMSSNSSLILSLENVYFQFCITFFLCQISFKYENVHLLCATDFTAFFIRLRFDGVEGRSFVALSFPYAIYCTNKLYVHFF